MSIKSINASRQKSAPASPKNSAASLQVSLPQMLDLALGTPEVGAVNFNILHNFLHVVLHQINLRTTKVEYRGDDANRIKTMVTSLKDGPSLHLHEYSITDGSGRVKQRVHSDENLTVNVDVYTDADAKLSRGSVSARETGSKQAMDSEKDAKKTKGVKQQISGGKGGNFESVIFVEPVVDGTTPSALSFKKLENSVQKLQKQFQVLEELATNPELINKVKGNNTEPIKDMWQIININKRLDASEQGISKLTSMLQDIIKGDKIEVQNGSDVTPQLTEIDQRLLSLEETIKRLLEGGNSSSKNIETLEPNSTDQPNSRETDEISNGPNKNLEKPTEESENVVQNSTENEPNEFNEMIANINSLKNDINQVRNDIAEIQSKFAETSKHNLRSEGMKSGTIGSKEAVERENGRTETTGDKNKNLSSTSIKNKEGNSESQSGERNLETPEQKEKNELGKSDDKERSNDEKLTRCLETVQNVETAINELNKKVDNLEKNTQISEIANNGPVEGVNYDKEPNIQELETKIQKIEEEMNKLIQSNQIAEDGNLTNTNNLREQIETLKVVKVDREDLEDALANKADSTTVNRKVSCDQFDVARDDLARGLEEAFDKLNQQESIWQQALDELQKEIECKLDKEEIVPFKESVDNKLRQLQGKLKTLLETKEPNEAAATKKMLRDVQCLSCDRDVVMRIHNNNPTYATALSSIKKMQLKPQQKKLTPQSYLETSLQNEINSRTKNSSFPKDQKHFSKRFCGGSHTILSPQQKIMRTGHFINEWGPQVVQLPAGLIKGSDGKMYHSRLLVGERSYNEPKICDPCDNKCNSQQMSKENAPQPIQENIEKKGSYVSEIEQIPIDEASIESRGRISKRSHDEDEMIMEDVVPPPSSQLEEKLSENQQQDDNRISTSKTMGVGSFFDDSKSIAQIAFEEDEDKLEEIEDQDEA